MKGDIHSFHMRHKGFIYYKRLQSYEVHKPLDHISLVSSRPKRKTPEWDCGHTREGREIKSRLFESCQAGGHRKGLGKKTDANTYDQIHRMTTKFSSKRNFSL